jgi:Na+-driven multidrug efflux pump
MSALELHNEQYSSARAIFSVAVPAIILNVAAPVACVLQTALIGRYAGKVPLAAFAAVSIVAGFAVRIFNFLVDGMSSKVGIAVGRKAWDDLAARVRMALLFSLAAGAILSVILNAARGPVCVGLLRLGSEVMSEAEGYWKLRIAMVPVVLLNMALSGILQVLFFLFQ